MVTSINNRGSLIHLSVVLEYACLSVIMIASASKGCNVYFNISSNPSFAVVEGSTFTVPFYLDTSQCKLNGAHPLYISVLRPPEIDGTRDGFCIIRLNGTECKPLTGDQCRCADANDDTRFVFTKNLTKADIGVWLWRTGLEDLEVRFTIHDGGTDSTTKESTPNGNKVSSIDGLAGNPSDQKQGQGYATQKHDNQLKVEHHTKRAESDEHTLKNSAVMTEANAGVKDHWNPDKDPLSSGLIVAFLNIVTIICTTVSVLVWRRRHPKPTRTSTASTNRPSCESVDDATMADEHQEP